MINVIGLGYIGLPTALMLASSGNAVVGVDNNKKTVKKLNEGVLTFKEEGLEEIYYDAVEKGITFSEEYISTDFYIITVPTPYDEKNKKIETDYLLDATKSVLDVCLENTIIVIESTVSPGTIEKYIYPLVEESKYKLNDSIFIAHAPERILPGNMIFELKNNARTIGSDVSEVAEKVSKVYQTFCEAEITCTDIRTAEMTKVIENTYRAVNIAFSNELTKLSKEANLDVNEIIRIANMHPRVNILNPGPGVGGHCIPVDPWFLVGDYPRHTKLINTALEINESMPSYVLKRMNEIMEEHKNLRMNKIGVYGLTYKPDVDDVRESPTLQMFKVMKQNFASPFKSFDPMLNQQIEDNQIMNFDDFVDECDAIILMVNHSHIIKNIDKLKGKIILDTQNIFEDAYKL